jgi:hypothetical protein
LQHAVIAIFPQLIAFTNTASPDHLLILTSLHPDSAPAP